MNLKKLDKRKNKVLKKARVNKYDFSFSSKGKDYSSFMYYSDDYFLIPSFTYNPSIITQSLSLVMSCFATNNYGYENKFQNCYDLLKKLGFSHITTNDYFKEKPTADSLGIVFGCKRIKHKTLICVVIRSANYESEWASNFKVGAEEDLKYHKGFDEASEVYIKSLKEYITNNNIKGKIILWSSGFSRGAAANNIASGKIDEYIAERKNYFGKKVRLNKKDFYSFCFESPQGVYTKDSYPKSNIFNNIYCILNFNDAVTKVVPSCLGFTRYGNELYLPDLINNINYNEIITEVKKQYQLMPNSEVLGEYKIDKFEMFNNKLLSKIIAGHNKYLCNWTQGIYLEDLLSILGKDTIISRENYTNIFQEGIREKLISFYSDNNFLGKDIISSFKQKNNKEDNDNSSLSLFMKRIKKTLIANRNLLIPIISESNLESLQEAHYPELCLSFVRSYDPNYTDKKLHEYLSGQFFKITLPKDKANISITIDDKQVVLFENGYPVKENCLLSCGTYFNDIIVYLPFNTTYNVISNKVCDIKIFNPVLNGYINSNIPYQETNDCFYYVLNEY